MSGCKKLTDIAVEVVLGCCPQMKILLFARCPRISGKHHLFNLFQCKLLYMWFERVLEIIC